MVLGVCIHFEQALGQGGQLQNRQIFGFAQKYVLIGACVYEVDQLRCRGYEMALRTTE